MPRGKIGSDNSGDIIIQDNFTGYDDFKLIKINTHEKIINI